MLWLRRAKAPEPIVVHVPRAGEPVKIDGELDEPSWQKSARRTFVRQDGSEAKPYSDIRLTWSDGTLHVGLYASDHDIVTAHVPTDGPVWRGDAFHVVFGKKTQYSIDVDAKCTISDAKRAAEGRWDYTWQSGAHAACDADGTIDQPGDNDEEWVVEMDVPLAAIGLSGKPGEHVELVARRCDVKEAGGKPLESPCPQIEPITIVLD